MKNWLIKLEIFTLGDPPDTSILSPGSQSHWKWEKEEEG